MRMINIMGDLLESDCDYIVHQVNCQKRMGSGIALQIKNKYPKTYNTYMNTEPVLGQVLFTVEDKIIANFYSQFNYKKPGENEYTFTNYDAFEVCCKKLKKHAINSTAKSIGFPYKIGCGLGGGDWNKVLEIIERVFNDTDLDIVIFQL